METRLALLFSEGVGKGRLTLNEFVALTATNPAKIYGLHPRKGTLAIACVPRKPLFEGRRHLLD